MSKRIQVVLSDDEHDRLKQMSKLNDRTVSAMGRRLIVDSIKYRQQLNILETHNPQIYTDKPL